MTAFMSVFLRCCPTGGSLPSEGVQVLNRTTDLPAKPRRPLSTPAATTPHSHSMANASDFRGRESMSPGHVAGGGLKACHERRDFIHCPPLVPAPGVQPDHCGPPVKYVARTEGTSDSCHVCITQMAFLSKMHASGHRVASSLQLL